MSTISAADLKRHGVSALIPVMAESGEATITVRGKGEYIVMTMEKYARLREAELDLAVRETRADYAAGRIAGNSIEAHLKRIDGNV